MIYYFSATGNNKYVAERIAEATNDTAVSIQDAAPYGVQADVVGFVFPTYGWGLPEIVKSFFSSLTIEKAAYFFFVSTYGTTPGFTGLQAQKLLSKRGIAIDSFFSIRMPDTWTPIFDLSNTEKVAEINQKADDEISDMLLKIKAQKHGNFMQRSMPHFTSIFAIPAYEKMRRTSHLKVDHTCIGCGLCAKKCPDHAIHMNGQRPEWVKEQCIMCLGCLHRCPKFAIQYENRTRTHGQYRHPGTRI